MRNLATCLMLLAVSVSCRGTAPAPATLSDAADSSAEQAFETELLRWRDSWQALNMMKDDWVDTYSACHKNPASDKLSDLQKLSYCFLPVEFRICNSLFIKGQDKKDPTDLTAKMRGFRECGVSSDMAVLVGGLNGERLYEEFFLKDGKNLSAGFRQRMIKAHMPEVSNEKFLVLVVRTVKRYVESRGGLDQAEVELTRTITPAVENPVLVAKTAKGILSIAAMIQDVANEYFDLF